MKEKHFLDPEERMLPGLIKLYADLKRETLRSIVNDGKGLRLKNGKAVHAARLSLKRARSLLRFLGEAGVVSGEKRALRMLKEAKDLLGPAREVYVLDETFGALRPELKREIPGGRLDALSETLIADSAIDAREKNAREQADRLVMLLRKATVATDAALAEAGDSAERAMLHDAVKASYRRARRAERAAVASARAADLHRWRRRSKDLRYQLEFICAALPPVGKKYLDGLHKLTDLLGSDRDFWSVGDRVEHVSTEGKPARKLRSKVKEVVAEHRKELRSEAVRLGRQLFDEKPRAFSSRICNYWTLSRVPIHKGMRHGAAAPAERPM